MYVLVVTKELEEWDESRNIGKSISLNLYNTIFDILCHNKISDFNIYSYIQDEHIHVHFRIIFKLYLSNILIHEFQYFISMQHFFIPFYKFSVK